MSDLDSERDRGLVASRVVAAVLIVVCLTAQTLLLLVSDHEWGGPVVLSFSDAHGVHLGDLPVMAVWLVGIVACVRLARSR